MDDHIEAIQELLQSAQTKLSAVEDSVVDLYEEPTPKQVGKVRNTLNATIKALQNAGIRLARVEAVAAAGGE